MKLCINNNILNTSFDFSSYNISIKDFMNATHLFVNEKLASLVNYDIENLGKIDDFALFSHEYAKNLRDNDMSAANRRKFFFEEPYTLNCKAKIFYSLKFPIHSPESHKILLYCISTTEEKEAALLKAIAETSDFLDFVSIK